MLTEAVVELLGTGLAEDSGGESEECELGHCDGDGLGRCLDTCLVCGMLLSA